MPMNKVVHAAQRAAFSAAIDVAINAVRGKGTEKLSENAVKLVNLAEPLLKDRYPASAFDAARKFVSDPNGKWMQYAYRAINEIDPHVLKMNALNLVYEGMFSGYNYVCELRKKYDCNMPWILLFDPTSACNLHCKGCWAAEYGNRLNLTYEEMDKLVTEGEELGIHWYMCTGGEPMCRKNDLLKLAAKHQSSVFHLFTNGTLIDDAFCEEVKKVGNMAFFLSVEGLDDATDSRRGEGVFQRVMNAMDIMKKHGLLFGTSICYTSANYKAVTSDEFMDMLISHGVRFNWYFHYMPIGDGANVDLMLNPEQREYMIQRVREIRGFTGGKQIFCIDFQNDGEYMDGCIAASMLTSTPTAMWSPAYSSITPAPTSMTRACWNACSSPCSRNITRASPSTATICVPARCWRTPRFWAIWFAAAVPTAPICSSRNPRRMFSAAAVPTQPAGCPPLTACGPKSTPVTLTPKIRKALTAVPPAPAAPHAPLIRNN